ncbi:Basic secretory protease [Bienertia sinuspersici]
MAHKINQLTTTLLLILAFTLAISREILAVDYTVTNNATSTNGGMVFANEIGEDYARQTLTSATNFIWQILQENTENDRKSIDQVTLTIVPSLPPQIVALTSNNQIQYSAESITSSDDIKTGFDGVIYHEMTHVWQWNGNGQANSGLIEGIADFVRLKVGYIVNGWAKPGDGDKWDAGYSVTARFLDYCESLMDGFVAQLNKKMRDGYSDSYFEDLLGKSVDQLWSDYKAKYGN